MESLKDKKILISGASIAGLSTAFCMHKLGYKITVVEIAGQPRINGAAINISGDTINVVKRMGIYDQLKAERLHVELIEFKNAGDITEGSILVPTPGEEEPDVDLEIERDKFMGILYNALKNEVEFIFNNSITALSETADDIKVAFKNGPERAFDLVIGCDGAHSGVRKNLVWPRSRIQLLFGGLFFNHYCR